MLFTLAERNSVLIFFFGLMFQEKSSTGFSSSKCYLIFLFLLKFSLICCKQLSWLKKNAEYKKNLNSLLYIKFIVLKNIRTFLYSTIILRKY